MLAWENRALFERAERLIRVGASLAGEHRHHVLLETILVESKSLANADGGTLYLKTEDETLKFEIIRNDSLGIAKGGTSGEAIDFPSLPLYDPKTGNPNHANVATHAAIEGTTIAIEDAYQTEDFDFSGTRRFDARTRLSNPLHACCPT